jgi:hypothetical protein
MLRLSAVLALAVSACTPVTPPPYLVAPADAAVSVRNPNYRNVAGDVRDFNVTGPKDWLEKNREVAPQSPSQGHRHE